AQAMADVLKERELDPGAARAALDDAAREAAGCRTDDTSAHFARFAVTFAPTGRVSAVDIEGGPLSGTSVGSCMIDAFKAAPVPAFSGAAVPGHKTASFGARPSSAGKLAAHARAPSRQRIELDAPAVLVDDFSRDGKPEPRARFLGGEKWVENLGQNAG